MHRKKTLFVLMMVFLVGVLQVAASEGAYKAKAGGTATAQITNLNPLTSGPSRLASQLPGQSSASSAAVQVAVAPATPTTEYVVKSGDTLWGIARNFNTTVDDIRALNNLKSDALSIGNKIKVSGQVPAVTVATVKSKSSSAQAGKGRGGVMTVADVEVSRSGSLAKAGTVLQTAAKYLGTPYKYGGSRPGGFDCSGFVQYVYGQYGYDLPRTAASQASVGKRVDKSNLKPGDLVFFACGTSGISHAGIYAGNGQFIHSSSPRSGGVIYSSLSESYYEESYVGARRVLP
ncbi:MAG TPA: NlpC/P60 family protein [Syntrophomonadaceae bacterium]|nr:NlpC/P60 family protein [Syntrophomonadaceae bacterium]